MSRLRTDEPYLGRSQKSQRYGLHDCELVVISMALGSIRHSFVLEARIARFRQRKTVAVQGICVRSALDSCSRPTPGSSSGPLVPAVEAALRQVLPRWDREYDDLLQSALETVLQAMRNDQFRGDFSISTWASKIARNVAIDAFRARSRERMP